MSAPEPAASGHRRLRIHGGDPSAQRGTSRPSGSRAGGRRPTRGSPTRVVRRTGVPRLQPAGSGLTWCSLHAEQPRRRMVTVAALQHGCHVFCEKPPGRYVADVVRFRRGGGGGSADETDLRLQPSPPSRGHRCQGARRQRFARPRADAARRVLRQVGRRRLRASGGTIPRSAAAGSCSDQGIHMLDLFRLLLRRLRRSDGHGGDTRTGTSRSTTTPSCLRNAAGQMAQLHSSATAWKHTFRLEIGLERATSR